MLECRQSKKKLYYVIRNTFSLRKKSVFTIQLAYRNSLHAHYELWNQGSLFYIAEVPTSFIFIPGDSSLLYKDGVWYGNKIWIKVAFRDTY